MSVLQVTFYMKLLKIHCSIRFNRNPLKIRKEMFVNFQIFDTKMMFTGCSITSKSSEKTSHSNHLKIPVLCSNFTSILITLFKIIKIYNPKIKTIKYLHSTTFNKTTAPQTFHKHQQKLEKIKFLSQNYN